MHASEAKQALTDSILAPIYHRISKEIEDNQGCSIYLRENMEHFNLIKTQLELQGYQLAAGYDEGTWVVRWD